MLCKLEVLLVGVHLIGVLVFWVYSTATSYKSEGLPRGLRSRNTWSMTWTLQDRFKLTRPKRLATKVSLHSFVEGGIFYLGSACRHVSLLVLAYTT